MSNYPFKIDDVISLPIVKDNFTKVTAKIINNLTEAIIKVESEMGIKPSGTKKTVRERLDYLETKILEMSADSGVLRVRDRALPGQTLIWNQGLTKWYPSNDFKDQNVKTSGQIESGTVNSTEFSSGMTVLDGKFIFNGINTPPQPAVSDSQKGAIYFDKTTKKLMVSEDGSPYQPISGLGSTMPPPNFFAGGDLSGDHVSQNVIGIRKIPISTSAPSDKQPLVFLSNEWKPSTYFGRNNVVTRGPSVVGSIKIPTLTPSGVIKSVGGGALATGLIFDADVDPAAAIDGKKIISNFGPQDVITQKKLISNNPNGYTLVQKIIFDSTTAPSITHGYSQPGPSIVENNGSARIEATTGKVYVRKSGSWKLVQATPFGPAGGDLTGSYPGPIVAKINGVEVKTAGGSLYVGNVLQSTSSNQVDYAPVKLDSGANYIINKLPSINQFPQSLFGDLDGNTLRANVRKIQNVAVKNVSPIPDSYLLKYDSLADEWVPSKLVSTYLPTGKAGGDLAGYYPSPFVDRLLGSSVKTKMTGMMFDFNVWPSGSTMPQKSPATDLLYLPSIPKNSINVEVTITGNNPFYMPYLQVFKTDGTHVFGNEVKAPGTTTIWSQLNSPINTSNILTYLYVSPGAIYNASSIQISATDLPIFDVLVSYNKTGLTTTLKISSPTNKPINTSLMLMVISAGGQSDFNVKVTYDYICNTPPKKGNILYATTNSSLEYGPIDLADNNFFITGTKLPSSFQAPQQLLGDVTGTTSTSKVTSMLNIPVNITSSSLTTDHMIGYSGGKWVPISKSGTVSASGAASGDLSGSYPGPTVAKLNGTKIDTMPSATAVGDILFFSSSTNVLTYGKIDLTKNIFKNKLPVSKQPTYTLSKDVTGLYNNNKVVSLNSMNVPSTLPATTLPSNYLMSSTTTQLKFDKIKMDSCDGYMLMKPIATVPVPDPNKTSIYYDNTQGKFLVSEAGGTWSPLLKTGSSSKKVKKYTMTKSGSTYTIGLPSSPRLLADDDINIFQVPNVYAGNFTIYVEPPAASALPDKKTITVSILANDSATCEIYVYFYNSRADITWLTPIKKRTATFMLDKSTNPTNPKWYYVDSGK